MPGKSCSLGRLVLLAMMATNAQASDAPLLEQTKTQTKTLPETFEPATEQTNPFIERVRSGKVILATGLERKAARGADMVSPLGSWSKFTLSSYAEYGATSHTSLIASTQRTNDELGPASSGGMGFRTHVAQWNEAYLFAEGMGHYGTGLARIPERSAFAADMRLGIGTVFKVMERDAFALATIGPRVIAGDSSNLRIDAALGVRPWRSLLVLIQSFNRIGEREYDGKRVSYARAQASLVWDAGPVYSAQVGVYASAASVKGRGERGVVAALWRRF